MDKKLNTDNNVAYNTNKNNKFILNNNLICLDDYKDISYNDNHNILNNNSSKHEINKDHIEYKDNINIDYNNNFEGLSSCDEICVSSYFDFYSKISNQQNMLQDAVRTQSYKNAISYNEVDFRDKIVIDVGTGSGVLAIFCANAGAKHVYAIEASSSAKYAEILFKSNNMNNKITLINKPIDSKVDLSNYIKEKADVIVSEPLGILLVNERMLETFILARNLYLKPDGKMYPSKSVLHFTLFSDEALYTEQIDKAKFWMNENFYDINLSELYDIALREKLSQPIIENYNPNTHVCNETYTKSFDFSSIDIKDLLNFTINVKFKIERASVVHGIAGWFETIFKGSDYEITLCTSPFSKPTHWYQVRLLFNEPLAMNKNQILKGTINFKANKFQSYNISINVKIEGLNIKRECYYDLKNPDFRATLYNNYNNM